MSEIKWVKLATDIFDDEKVKILDNMPDHDAILLIWIKLIAQAGKCNDFGKVYVTQGLPFNEEMIATVFNRPLNTIRLALESFEKLGMIRRYDNFIQLVNFDKHQNLDGMERVKALNRERNKAYRARQKEETKLLLPHNDVSVTSHDAVDIDKNKNRKEIYKESYDSPFKDYQDYFEHEYGILLNKTNADILSTLSEEYSLQEFKNASRLAKSKGKLSLGYVQSILKNKKNGSNGRKDLEHHEEYEVVW